jgi:hypothetical protein
MEIFILTKSTSTKTACQLQKAITSTVAAKVKSAVITSSPGFKSQAPSWQFAKHLFRWHKESRVLLRDILQGFFEIDELEVR